jgi:tetratricopeptide (TPR) repeat protein
MEFEDVATRHKLLALYAEHVGDMVTAQSHYDSLRVAQESSITSSKSLTRKADMGYGALGVTLAALGQARKAIEAGQYSVSRFPLNEDALFGFVALERMAEIYLRAGEHEKAIDTIETILSVPGNLSVGDLKLDPLWDPLRSYPRFKALVSESF